MGGVIKIFENDYNLGVGKTRDRGINLATGKYIMFIDADDTIEPETVSECVRLMEIYQSELVEFNWRRVREIPPSHCNTEDADVVVYDNPEEIERMSADISCNKMYKTNIIRNNRLQFIHRVFEDTLFTRKYALACKKAVFTQKILYNYFIISDSLSSGRSLKTISDNARIEELLKFYSTNGMDKQRTVRADISQKSLIRSLIPHSRKPHENFIWAIPNGDFALATKPYIDKFNKSGLLFRLSAYKLLGLRSSVRIILRHGI